MAAKGNSGLWKETTAISKEVSKEGQIAHIIPGWECVHCNLKVWNRDASRLAFHLALLAFWSEFASAFAAQVHSLCASVTAVYLSFFVFGRVLTRLD